MKINVQNYYERKWAEHYYKYKRFKKIYGSKRGFRKWQAQNKGKVIKFYSYFNKVETQ